MIFSFFLKTLNTLKVRFRTKGLMNDVIEGLGFKIWQPDNEHYAKQTKM